MATKRHDLVERDEDKKKWTEDVKNNPDSYGIGILRLSPYVMDKLEDLDKYNEDHSYVGEKIQSIKDLIDLPIDWIHRQDAKANGRTRLDESLPTGAFRKVQEAIASFGLYPWGPIPQEKPLSPLQKAKKEVDDLLAKIAELQAEHQVCGQTVTAICVAERQRLWDAMVAHWHGDMGPAYIYVKDIEPLFESA